MKNTLLILCLTSIIACCPDAGKHTQNVLPEFTSWAKTPPMGWNSYNAYKGAITEPQFLACVDWLADNLLPYGYDLATIDFCWSRPGPENWSIEKWFPHKTVLFPDSNGVLKPDLEMDAYGRLMPDPGHFPSAINGIGFKEIGDYVHSKGMKFGIHIMRGVPRKAVEQELPILGTEYTCDQIAETTNLCPWNNHMYGVDQSLPGAQEYYNSIINMYAEWGVDFIKADDMMVPPYHTSDIELLRKAIDQCGRPIVLSLSCGEAPLSKAHHLLQNANMWRISADFWDKWEHIERMFELTEMWSPFIGNGTWPDNDMIPIGRLQLDGHGKEVGGDIWRPERDSRFTEAGHYALMSLNAITRSPLIWGGDPLTSSDWSVSFLTNKEVLAVNQNSENNRQIFERNDTRVWIAEIPDSEDLYLGLFNLKNEEHNVKFDFWWEQIKHKLTIRDLWDGKELGTFEKEFVVTMRPHEGRLYRLSKAIE